MPILNCIQTYKRKMQWNELKGEKQKETAEYFPYYLSLV